MKARTVGIALLCSLLLLFVSLPFSFVEGLFVPKTDLEKAVSTNITVNDYGLSWRGHCVVNSTTEEGFCYRAYYSNAVNVLNGSEYIPFEDSRFEFNNKTNQFTLYKSGRVSRRVQVTTSKPVNLTPIIIKHLGWIEFGVSGETDEPINVTFTPLEVSEVRKVKDKLDRVVGDGSVFIADDMEKNGEVFVVGTSFSVLVNASFSIDPVLAQDFNNITADTFLNESSVGTNYGSDVVFYTTSAGYSEWGLIRLNHSIPSGANSSSIVANMSVHRGGGGDGSVQVHHYTNESWTEGGADWTGNSGASNYNSSIEDAKICNTPVYYTWNITQMTQRSFDAGNDTVSVLFKQTTGTEQFWDTVEQDPEGIRPKAEIFYRLDDATDPAVTIDLPTNATYTYDLAGYTFNVTCTDAGEGGCDSCWADDDFVSYHIRGVGAGTEFNITNHTAISFGDHVVTVSCNDTSGNTGVKSAGFTLAGDWLELLNFTLEENNDSCNVNGECAGVGLPSMDGARFNTTTDSNTGSFDDDRLKCDTADVCWENLTYIIPSGTYDVWVDASDNFWVSIDNSTWVQGFSSSAKRVISATAITSDNLNLYLWSNDTSAIGYVDRIVLEPVSLETGDQKNVTMGFEDAVGDIVNMSLILQSPSGTNYTFQNNFSLIDAFDAVGDWIAVISRDDLDPVQEGTTIKQGTYSVNFSTDISAHAGNAAGWESYDTDASDAKDLSNITGVSEGTATKGILGWWSYTADSGYLASMFMQLWIGNDSTANYMHINADKTTYGVTDGWTLLRILFTDLTLFGYPDWTNVTMVHFNWYNNDTADFDTFWDYMVAYDNANLYWNGYNSFQVNHTLNDSGTWTVFNEVTHYNDSSLNINTTSGTFLVNDTTAPSITLDDANYTNESTGTGLTFNITCSDTGSGCDSAWTNHTDFTSVDDTSQFNITNNTELGEGTFAVEVCVNDSYNGLEGCDIFIYSYDATPPTLTIDLPTNATLYNETYALTLNITCTDSLGVYGVGTNSTDFATLDTTLPYNITNDSALSDQRYAIEVWCNDTDVNHTVYKDVYFDYDVTLPVITLDDTNYTNESTGTGLTLNITCADAGVGCDSAWTNNTDFGVVDTSAPYNLTNDSTLTEGTFAVEICINDTVNNKKCDIFLYTADYTNPSITIDSVNNTWYNDTTVFNITATDTVAVDAVYSNDTQWPVVDTSAPYNETNGTTIGETQGLAVKWCVNDTVNHETCDLIIIKFDKTLPAVTLDDPANNTFINETNTSHLNFTITDTNLDTITLWNGTVNVTDTAPFNFSVEGWTGGAITPLVFANDSANNINFTSLNFTLDNTNPSILLDNPSNNSYQNNGTYFNFTITDTNLDTALWSNDSFTTNNTETSPFNLSTSGWTGGTHTLYWRANDSINNENVTIFTLLLDDGVAPTIKDVSSSPSCIEVSGRVTLYWSVNDTYHMNVSFCNITSPALTSYISSPFKNGNGTFSCDRIVDETGDWNFTVYANDSAGNDAENQLPVIIKNTGGCGGAPATGGGTSASIDYTEPNITEVNITEVVGVVEPPKPSAMEIFEEWLLQPMRGIPFGINRILFILIITSLAWILYARNKNKKEFKELRAVVG